MALVTGARCKCGEQFSQVHTKIGGKSPKQCRKCTVALKTEAERKYLEEVEQAKESAYYAASCITKGGLLRAQLVSTAEFKVMRALICKLAGGEKLYWDLVTMELES